MDNEEVRYILNVLRQGTVHWKGRTDCLNRGRRKRVLGWHKNGKEKSLWENNCEGCDQWFLLKDNLLEVDHIVEVGSFLGCFNDYVRKMYCRQDNLQRLCFSCHQKKTSKGNASIRHKRKVENLL